MSWKLWFASLRRLVHGPARPRSARRCPPLYRARPWLEALEHRLAPAVTTTFTATSVFTPTTGILSVTVLAADAGAQLTVSSSLDQITIGFVPGAGNPDTLSAPTGFPPAPASAPYFTPSAPTNLLTINTAPVVPLPNLANIPNPTPLDITEVDVTVAGNNDTINFSLGNNVNSGSTPQVNNVGLKAGGTGDQFNLGTIALNGNLNVNSTSGATGVVGISVNSGAAITTQGGNVVLGTLPGSNGQPTSNDGPIDLFSGASITTQGGNMALTGQQNASTPTGISIVGATLNAVGGPNGGGNISLIGAGSATGYGIDVSNFTSASVVESGGTGTVTIQGFGGAAGVHVSGSLVSTATGALGITGTPVGNKSSNAVVDVEPGSSIATAGGNITLSGQGGIPSKSSDPSSTDGVNVIGATVNADGGNIALTGQGISDGVLVLSGTTNNAALQTFGTGTITINGTGTINGVVIESFGTMTTTVSTVYGNLSVTGTVASSSLGGVYGVEVVNPNGTAAATLSTMNGNLTVTGTVTGGVVGGAGVGLYTGVSVQITGGGTGAITIQGSGALGVQINNVPVTAGVGGVTITGTANGEFSGEYGVDLEGGAQVTDTTTGSISLKGNGSPVGTDSNAGVRVNGTNTSGTQASTVSTVNGNVSLTGTGGGSGQMNYGIDVEGGGKVQASGAGSVSLTGTGPGIADPSNPSGSNNDGVYLAGSGTQVSALAGGVTVTGTGGGAASSEYGVDVESGAQVMDTTTGAIKITGTGSAIGTNSNAGVRLNGSSAQVTTVNGNVSLTGTGGGSGQKNYGLDLEGGPVKSTGAGSVNLTGTAPGVSGGGGTPQGDNNMGVYLTSTLVSAEAGGVTVTGTGNGAGANGYGVDLESGAQVMATESGAVTIKGTASAVGTNDNAGVRLNGSSGSGTEAQVGTQNGALTIQGSGGGTGVGNHGIDLEDGVEVESELGAVSLTGTAGNGSGEDNGNESGQIGNVGVYVAGATVSAGAGGVTISGTGNGAGEFNRGVDVESAATGSMGEGEEETGGSGVTGATVAATANGTVTIKGTGSPLGDDGNNGVFISGSGTSVTTQSGALTIQGTGGGSGEDNYGIDVRAEVESQQGGAVSLSGTGGNGDADSSGVYIIAGGVVQAGAGGVSLTGTGIGTGSDEYGVDVEGSATVTANANGTISIKGTGSALGSDYAAGVYINIAASNQPAPAGPGPQVTTQSGAITIQGTAGGTGQYDYGVDISASVEAQQGGAISISGTGGNGSGQCDAGVFISGGQLQAGAGGLSVTGVGNGSGQVETGVDVENGAQVSDSTNGAIKITGTGSALGTDNSDGIYVGGVAAGSNTPTRVTTIGGNLTLTGTGNGTGHQIYGIDLEAGTVVQVTGAGALSLSGTGGSGTDHNIGVLVNGSGTLLTTTVGNLTIAGSGGNGSGDDNAGVVISTSGQGRISTNRGTLSVSGTGAGQGNGEDGVDLTGGARVAATLDGTVKITGSGGAGLGSCVGVFITGSSSTPTQVSSLDSTVTVNGTGGNGTGDNDTGVVISNAQLSGGTFGLSVTGSGAGLGNNEDGVVIASGAQLSATQNGTVSIKGTGGASIPGSNNDVGVIISDAGTRVTTLSGTLTIQGSGGDTPGGEFISPIGQPQDSDNYGVDVQGGALVQGGFQIPANSPITPGPISITGTGGGGLGLGFNNIGTVLLGTATNVTTAGKLTLAGTGGTGAGSDDDGVLIAGAQVSLTPLADPPIQGHVSGSNPDDKPLVVQANDLTPIVGVSAQNAVYNAQPYAGATGTVAGLNLLPLSDLLSPSLLTQALFTALGQVAASSLEGVPVTFTYFNSTGVQLSGAPVDVGNYTAVGTFLGSPDYASATSNTAFETPQPFSITPAPAHVSVVLPSVSPLPLGTVVYNGSAPTVTAQVTGVSNVTLTSGLVGLQGSLYTLSFVGITTTGVPYNSSTPPVNAGTYNVTASFPGSLDYLPSSTSQAVTLTIKQATPVIAFGNAVLVTTNTAIPPQANVKGVVTGVDDSLGQSLEAGTLQLTYHNGLGVGAATGQTVPVPVKPGQYSVVASFPGSEDYAPLTLQQAFTVSPAAAHSFTFAPATTVAGTPFSVNVTPFDQFGNPASFNGTISVASSDLKFLTTAAFNSALSIDNSTGITSNSGTIGGLELKTASATTIGGTQTLTFTFVSSATGTIQAPPFTVTVNPAPLFQLSVISGPSGSVQAGTYNLIVNAQDQYGNLVSDSAAAGVTDSLSGSLSVSPASPAFSGGVLNVNVTLSKLGANNLTVTSPPAGGSPLSTPVIPLTVTAGPVAAFVVTPSISIASTVAAGTTFNLTVQAQDQFANPATNFGGTVTLSSTDAQAVGLGNYSFANAPTPGQITITGVALKTVGQQTFTVSYTSGTPPTTISKSTGTIAISALTTVDHLAVALNPPSATVTINTNFSLIITAQDKFNNTVSGFNAGSSTIKLTTTPAGGITSTPITGFTAATNAFVSGVITLNGVKLTTHGTQTITVQAGNGNPVSMGSLSLTDPPATPNVLDVSSDAETLTGFSLSGAGPVTAGTAFSATLVARDQSGNVMTTFIGPVQLSSTDPLAPNLGTITFTPAGRGVVTINGLVLKTAGDQTVTIASAVVTSTSSITVKPTTVAKLVVTSAPSMATAGTPFDLTVTAEDRYGNTVTSFNRAATLAASLGGSLVSPATGSFSGGVLALTGVILKKAGSQKLTITAGTLVVSTGAIGLSPGALARFAVSGPAKVAAGTPFTVTVTAQDQYGNTVIGFTGSVRMTSNDPLVPSLGSFAFTQANKGVRSLSGLVLKTRTAEQLTVTSDNGDTEIEGVFSITV
ncbi:MAG TPA: hypothetical protein VKA46_34135 [Gemmataceae bacterium]|nr:hypothetical protein [Gemmataceae bacterium]